MTVGMLLDHTSGLPDFFLSPRIDKPLQAEPDAAWTPERAWSYVTASARSRAARGVLQHELPPAGGAREHVTGRPLAAEVRDRLLDPLRLCGPGTRSWRTTRAARLRLSDRSRAAAG